MTELQKDPVGSVTDSDRLEKGFSLSSRSKGKKAHLASFVLASTWERDSRSFGKEMNNGITNIEGGKCRTERSLSQSVCPLGFGVHWSVNTPRKEQQQQSMMESFIMDLHF